VIRTVWNAVKTVVMAVVNFIVGFIRNNWNTIKSATSTAWNAIKNVVKTVWSAIKTVISTIMNTIKSVFRAGWAAVRGIFVAAWNALKAAVVGPAQFIVDKIQWIIDKAAAAMQTLRDLFSLGIEISTSPQFQQAVAGLVQGQLPNNPVDPPGGISSPFGGHSGSHVDNGHFGPAQVAGNVAVVVDIDGVAVTQLVRMHSNRMRVRLGGRR